MPGHLAREDAIASIHLRIVRKLGLAIAVALLAVAGTVGPAAAAWSPGFSASDEQLLFALTNQDRASAGLPALLNDSYLHGKAEWRAQDMGDRDYFSHQIPPGTDMVFVYMQQDGYCFKIAGENIGLSTFDDDVATATIETGFMGSPGHRQNIMGSWDHMGVGAYKATDGRKLYAVLFSITCAAAPKPTAPPTAPPTANPTAQPTTNSTANPTAQPTTNSTANPTAQPTAKPTLKPTAKPTAKPTTPPTPNPTPTPAASPTSTSQPTPTESASENPSATSSQGSVPTPPVELATPSSSPSGAGVTPSSSPATGAVIGDTSSGLRVREKAPASGLLDSLFQTLFGGLLGS
jgi:uncharacterized protein YkwD